jgi:hypothetical protein
LHAKSALLHDLWRNLEGLVNGKAAVQPGGGRLPLPLSPTFVARALDGFHLGHRRVCIGGAAFARGPAGIAVEAVGKAIVIAIRIEQVDEPIAVSAPVRGY